MYLLNLLQDGTNYNGSLPGVWHIRWRILLQSLTRVSQDILILLVTIPMWINTLLRTYAWISLLSDNGIVNSLLKVLGINPATMMYTDFSVVMGLVCDLLPFMVIPIHTSLAKMDYSLVEAANDFRSK